MIMFWVLKLIQIRGKDLQLLNENKDILMNWVVKQGILSRCIPPTMSYCMHSL